MNSNDESVYRNIEQIKNMKANPCPDGEHDYEDYVYTTQSMGTMLHVLCKKCLDMQGWIMK